MRRVRLASGRRSPAGTACGYRWLLLTAMGLAAAPGRGFAGQALPTVPPIRVLLTDGPVPTLDVAVHGPCQWRLAGADQVLGAAPTWPAQPVRPAPDGIQVGSTVFPTGRLELVPAKDGSLFVGPRAYRGWLRLLKQSDGRLLAINVVDLEAYVASVTSGEMKRQFPLAARQAQAVAARTYAVFQMKSQPLEAEFDVYASVRDQHYPGYNWETTDSQEAARFTRGIVATYQGRVFCAYYASCCGGATASAAEVLGLRPNAAPVLVSVPCPWCRHPDNDRFAWEAVFEGKEMTEKLQACLALRNVTIGEVIDIRIVSRTSDGRVSQLEVQHTGGTVPMSAEEFRKQAGGYSRLQSTRFDIRRADGRFVVTGTGWGHGVGLCQWGARALAEQGKNCVEILRYYYPGCGLAMIY